MPDSVVPSSAAHVTSDAPGAAAVTPSLSRTRRRCTGRSTHRTLNAQIGQAGCVAPGARARRSYVGMAEAAYRHRRSAQVAAAERFSRPSEINVTSRAYRARRSRPG